MLCAEMLREINFDGIVGPSHNFAGLSLGNLSSTRHGGSASSPRSAALAGIEKMRVNLRLGLVQGIFLPHARPNAAWLARLGTSIESADQGLRASALSASAMWAANAATVSPAPDTADRKCHLTVANLVTMPHRSHEWTGTLSQLRLAFADAEHFVIHPPVPAPFGDEGAANHMRLSSSHAEQGIEVFVYGESGSAFPARQHRQASEAIARLHGLDPCRVFFAEQSPMAIAAGAFHNDVLAVANEHVLLAHANAFARPSELFDAIRRELPQIEIIEAPSMLISLDDAISSYLFNAQLVSLHDGGMALVVPTEAQDNTRVWTWLQSLVAGKGPIRRVVVVDVRQSMANGGGPACLRLRIVADPRAIDRRFLVDQSRLDLIGEIVTVHWPEKIESGDLANPDLWGALRHARSMLLGALKLTELD